LLKSLPVGLPRGVQLLAWYLSCECACAQARAFVQCACVDIMVGCLQVVRSSEVRAIWSLFHMRLVCGVRCGGRKSGTGGFRLALWFAAPSATSIFWQWVAVCLHMCILHVFSDVLACAFALSHACLLVCLYAALCPATFKLFVGSGFRALSVWCICLCLLSIHGSVLHPPCNPSVRPLGAACVPFGACTIWVVLWG